MGGTAVLVTAEKGLGWRLLMGSKQAVNRAALWLVSVVMERKRDNQICGARLRPRLVRTGECIECVALSLVSWSLMLKHRHTHARTHLLSHSVHFARPTVPVRITVCRSTLSQYKRRKDGFHFKKRKCFSLELKAEIINTVDMKRKMKAQIYREHNIKIFVWNSLYLLERQRSHRIQPKGPWVAFILLTNRGSN